MGGKKGDFTRPKEGHIGRDPGRNEEHQEKGEGKQVKRFIHQDRAKGFLGPEEAKAVKEKKEKAKARAQEKKNECCKFKLGAAPQMVKRVFEDGKFQLD